MAILKTPFLFLTSLTFLFHLSCLSSAAFLPLDNYLLNCGSSITTTTFNNRNFISDSSESSSSYLSSTQSISLTNQNPSPNTPSLYQTARVFTKPSHYKFKINRKGTQVVRLHFFPFQSPKSSLSNALFHVSANGVLLLSSKTKISSSIFEYFIWVDSDELVISFIPLNFGFVNAIEVFTAPDDLIADTAKYVKYENTRDIFGLTRQGFETVYRLNVGGAKVTPFNDTLWRTWVPDEGVLKANKDAVKEHFSGRIKYQSGGLSREVGPDNVYNSARVMKKDSNMTWVFDVSMGYKYLVRMHFCDIASRALNELYFNVYVNGYLATEDLDLSSLTSGTLAAPYYADFVVDGDCMGGLSVSVGPSKLSKDFEVKAILNGLEVMKMNNSMGSLDGEVSADSVLNSSESADIGVLVPLLAIVGLVAIGFVYLQRKRAALKESVGWSPLPVVDL